MQLCIMKLYLVPKSQYGGDSGHQDGGAANNQWGGSVAAVRVATYDTVHEQRVPLLTVPCAASGYCSVNVVSTLLLFLQRRRNKINYTYTVSNIGHTLGGNNMVYHSDAVGASSVGAAPTTSQYST